MHSKNETDCQEPAHQEPVRQDAGVLLNDAIASVDSIINAFNYQVLGNADGLHEVVSDLDEQARLKYTVETMIKKPFRRQVGRMRSLQRLLAEVQKKLPSQQGDK